MEPILFTIWIFGWVAATLFSALVIGNVDNVPGSGEADFPTFMYPLLFGWAWPAVLALALIVAPLSILSDRTTKRARLKEKDHE